MTLYRQLLIAIVLTFTLIGVGIESIYLSKSRSYLQDQMESHSQDAATALGLSLPTAIAANDPVLADSIVGAAFDRGFYSEIRVIDARGETLVLRQSPPSPPEVPAWFVAMLHLDAPATESLITTGWRNAGRVLITSQLDSAYRQLWDTARNSLVWLVALLGGTVLMSALYLRSILRPLVEIEQAARNIGARNFATIAMRPRSRELRQAVDTINSLSAKVQGMLDQEIARAMEWRRQAFADPVTGLDNRRGFEQQVSDRLTADRAARGALFIIELNDFKTFNEREGFQCGDELLSMVGASLAHSCQNEWLFARIGGATFAVFAQDIDHGTAAGLGQQLCRDLAATLGEQGCPITFQCGGAGFEACTTVSALLATADSAVEKSRQAGANACLLIDGASAVTDGHGSGYWKQLIQDAVEQNHILLFAQPVVSADGNKVLQQEIMGRISDGAELPIAAEQFMPMALRHGLMGRFDLAMLSRSLQWLQSMPPDDSQVAINLSLQTIRDEDVRCRIMDMLAASPALAARLVFEVSEFVLTHDIESGENFAKEVRQRGADFSVDNFGLHCSAFAYLLRLKPAYIKLSPSLTAKVMTDASQRMFVSSVVSIALPLEIAVYAVRVESDGLAAALNHLGVVGHQGYLSGSPEPIDF